MIPLILIRAGGDDGVALGERRTKALTHLLASVGISFTGPGIGHGRSAKSEVRRVKTGRKKNEGQHALSPSMGEKREGRDADWGGRRVEGGAVG